MAESRFKDDEMIRIYISKYPCSKCDHKLCNICAYLEECHACHQKLTGANLAALRSFLEARRVREASEWGLNPNMIPD